MIDLNQRGSSMNKVVRISILADSFEKISWNIFDWKDENTKILYKELINLIELINENLPDNNSKLLLTSSLELGVDIIFSQIAIDLQKILGKNKILTRVAIPYLNQDVRYSEINRKRYSYIIQNTDIVEFLSNKISDRIEINKSRYWRIDNSDYLIIVTSEFKSEVIKYARDRKIPVLIIKPEVIKSITIVKKRIFEYSYPLIYRERNYAGVVIDSAKKLIGDYSRQLLNLEIDFEEDKELSRKDLENKYSILSLEIARAFVIFIDLNSDDYKNNLSAFLIKGDCKN